MQTIESCGLKEDLKALTVAMFSLEETIKTNSKEMRRSMGLAKSSCKKRSTTPNLSHVPPRRTRSEDIWLQRRKVLQDRVSESMTFRL